ncbi:MAG: cytochrome c oxidase subunit II [Candidatus Roizmanbacteria bacterium GW2011_GWC2_34_23]|uniref:Cytochrome c oxidase subunit II n=1 Tax=Candidatus Roizmanbacteria bacterium GW2011_GWC2_34_23 TaxID=1618484 RepID=A0A0G0AX56_9BACT|nr:MAG: cytochrome c oxidase subunit II [Candidatus Roizmanbacteria bacterium GW2011_GWC2_34_23]
MKKYLLAAFFLLLVGGIFFLNQKKPAMKQGLTSATTVTSDKVKEFSIIAKKWQFDPSTINVKQGDKVRLKIKSIDVAHGFSLLDFNVNENLEPGKEITVEFVADKKGEFTFFCSVFCGVGHIGMKGKLVVE